MLDKVESGMFFCRNFAIFIEIVSGFEIVIVGNLLSIWNGLLKGK